jgi:hypothetical protein
MENNFVIAWRSKSEPRWGQGKKLFTREEAQALADEMNRDYPAFFHEPLNLAASETTPAPEPAIIQIDFTAEPEEAIPVAEEAVQEMVGA